MTQYLLDTNALSETAKTKPDKGYLAWLLATENLQLFTSCLSLGEIEKGIHLLTRGANRRELEGWMVKVMEDFEGRIVGVDYKTGLLWGQLMAVGQQSGKTAPAIDALIAAQCIQHRLTLITRNVKDFEQFADLEVFCPWTEAKSLQ